MNTKDLAKQVADQLGTTEKQARELLDAALNAIGQAAAAGDEINLPGFGKFKVKSMSERSGRNPATGEAITICLLYTSPSPRDKRQSRMPSSA